VNVPLVLCGPTGAGKSALALHIAAEFEAVIVSMDAMAVYRGFDIGTAKPTAADRAAVHHLGIDVVDPTASFDAADFCRLLDDALRSWPRVVVCGGTHLYLKAWRDGLASAPPVDPSIRSALEAERDLHAWLARVDGEAARRIHPNDRVRLVRALEVWLATGRPISAAWREGRRNASMIAVGVDAEDLEDRLRQRTAQMLADGWLDEVDALLEAGVPRTCRPMRGLGYRDLVRVRDGHQTLEVAALRIGIDTRHLARKQRMWLRSLGVSRVEDAQAVARAAADAMWSRPG
jgi:tRNA dimethylallyltransferase